jgi:probable HAF family extracellular repeat protein
MKSRFAMATTAVLLAVFMVSAAASAQDQSITAKQANRHRYRLIDLGTFAGPSASFGTAGDRISEIQTLNQRGEVTGLATTPAPDPYPDFCWDGDCLLAHAFQWQNGVMTDLGALVDGVNSDQRWIADNGLISGDSENGELDPLNPGFPEIRAVLWKHGQIIDLGTLDGGYESIARAVNSKGQVVGVSLNTIPDPNSITGSFYGVLYQQTRAFLWQDGVMQDLGTLGTGNNAIAVLINERGQVVGDSYTSTDPSTFCFYNDNVFPLTTGAFLWEKGEMTDLGGLGGTCTLASALNNRGQVAGWSNLAGDQAYHAFRWDAASQPHLRDLGTLGGSRSIASAMNEAGHVVGSAQLPGSQEFHATLWRRHLTIDLGTVGTDQCSEAFSINSSDQVVGISHSQCGADDANAFLWERGQNIDLNAFVPPGSDLHLRAGATINDRGEIAVVGAFPDGDHRAVLLVPCDDEPADSAGCREAAVPSKATQSVEKPGVVVTKEGRRPLPYRRSDQVGRSHISSAMVGPTR